MADQEVSKYLSKYMPSAQKLFIHGGLAILISLALGYMYAMFFMDAPADLAKEDEYAFRQGISIGVGLIYIAPAPLLALIIRFIYQLFRAQKLAIEDYTKDLIEKYKK
ncbi:hypothetical protein [Stutzerimonas stutzeri]|uniref:hypothetical protein n=1 Tax=Stutzerimonas stutzeri TaxID=316 RepID=UPI00244CF7DE|nr:hypothetical protein [Stutzerimonas stutzeri]MDH0081391.1 hypothetical protein [Stutzerimonas stutzeri]